MKNKDIWIVEAEVDPINESASVPIGTSDVVATCFVPAGSIEDSIETTRRLLLEDGYRLYDLVKSTRYDSDEWNDENDPQKEIRNKVNESAEIQGIVYGDFYWND